MTTMPLMASPPGRPVPGADGGRRMTMMTRVTPRRLRRRWRAAMTTMTLVHSPTGHSGTDTPVEGGDDGS